MNKSKLFLAFLSTTAFAPCEAAVGLPSAAELLKGIDLRDEEFSGDSLIVADQQRLLIRSEANIASAIRLWKSGLYGTLELAWYKQTNRKIRMIIVALFVTQSDMELGSAPDFADSSRFAADESRERKEEIEAVRRHVVEFKQLLEPLLSSKTSK